MGWISKTVLMSELAMLVSVVLNSWVQLLIFVYNL